MHHIVLNACLAYKATLMFLCVGGLYDWEVRAFLNDGEVRKQLARVLAADKQLRPAARIRRYVWVYKHHMAIHLPLMMAKFGILVGCFHLERKHRLVKRFVMNQRTEASYERHLILEVTAQQVHDLENWSRRGGLIDSVAVGGGPVGARVLAAVQQLRPAQGERGRQWIRTYTYMDIYRHRERWR